MDTPDNTSLSVEIAIIQSSLACNKQIRTAMRALRKSQSLSTIQEKSETIARHITSKLQGPVGEVVACYRAQDREVDLDTVIRTLFRAHVKVVLPVVRERNMRFSLIQPHSEFVTGKFGIDEPVELDLVEPWEIDLVFAPLVAFSSSGNRLGRGGGYYDRVFSDNNQTVLVGVGFEFQHSDKFITHARDKPLDAVVTEAGWCIFRTNKLLSDSEV